MAALNCLHLNLRSMHSRGANSSRISRGADWIIRALMRDWLLCFRRLSLVEEVNELSPYEAMRDIAIFTAATGENRIPRRGIATGHCRKLPRLEAPVSLVNFFQQFRLRLIQFGWKSYARAIFDGPSARPNLVIYRVFPVRSERIGEPPIDWAE